MKVYINKIAKKIERLFLWSSGADMAILSQVPIEKNKFLGIGGTILFTAIMASFAGGYAFFTAFKSVWLSFIFGIFWGALIYNLDRFIVSTFGSGDGKKTISRQELMEASPRLLMAILLGFVISTPLELKIFEKEIKLKVEELKNMKSDDLRNSDSAFFNGLKEKKSEYTLIESKLEKFTTEKSQLIDNSVKWIDQQKEAMEAEYANKDAAVNEAFRNKENALASYNQAKRDSLPASVKNARSANYQSLQRIYLNKIDERDKVGTQIKELQDNRQKAILDESARVSSEIANLTNARNILQDDILNLEKSAGEKNVNYNNTSRDYDGFAAHLEAMDMVTQERPILFYVKWLITLLFIFIEIAPILFKMMTERGPYDDIMDRIKHEHKVRQLEMKSNINQEINTAVRIHSDKYEQKLNKELESNKSLLDAIAKAQQEIALVAIEQWKKEQMEKIRNGDSIIVSK